MAPFAPHAKWRCLPRAGPRPKHSLDVGPPSGIFRALGVKKDHVESGIAMPGKRMTRIVLHLNDNRSQSRASEVLCGQIDLESGKLDSCNRPADAAGGACEPQC